MLILSHSGHDVETSRRRNRPSAGRVEFDDFAQALRHSLIAPLVILHLI